MANLYSAAPTRAAAHLPTLPRKSCPPPLRLRLAPATQTAACAGHDLCPARRTPKASCRRSLPSGQRRSQDNALRRSFSGRCCTFSATCPVADGASLTPHPHAWLLPRTMGNLCGKQSKDDNFAGPGRTLGSAPPPSDNARASIPAAKKQSPLQGNGRTLGAPGESSGNDPRSAAARAAEVRSPFRRRPSGQGFAAMKS